MIEKERTFEFKSIFAPEIVKYLDLKKSMGGKIIVPGTQLRLFDRYCFDHDISDATITNELVDNWLNTFPNVKKNTRATKITALKGFSEYYRSTGNMVEWEAKPGYTARQPHYVPYIFTEDEIKRIFAAADSLRPNNGKTRFHIMFPVILRTLYGTGIRISEALNLKVKDVDLENGFLRIYGGKFNKNRRIPLSSSLSIVLKNYYKSNVDYIGVDQDAYFFPTAFGERYSQRTVYDKFREILWKSEIPHQGKGKGPRLHDLRHTFAVRSLHQSVSTNKNIYVSLTALMVYLGHSKISSTEYYLRLTADVFPEILEKTSDYSKKIIPKEIPIDD